VVAESLQQPGERQRQGHGEQHGVAHLAGAGGADEQAVEQVAPHRDRRQRGQVGQVGLGQFAHRRDVGLQADEQRAAAQEEQRKAQAGQQRPQAGDRQRPLQGGAVAAADSVPAQRLDGVGQAVQGVGGEQQAVEQQGVGRHRGVAEPGALHGDQEEHQLQEQAAQEDVAVHRQQRAPARPAAQGVPGQPAGMPAQRPAGQRQAEQGAAPLGEHRGAGGAGHAPVEAEDEPQVERHVAQAGEQQHGQRRAGVLRAEQPADQRVAGQYRRQAEQADVEILAAQRIERRRGLHQAEGEFAEGQRQQAQQQGEDRGEQQALQQHLAQRGAVGAAAGLGSEAGGAHAQEAEGPGQQGEQAAADRHRAELVGVRQVADHRAVDQGHQRRAEVGENHRRGQRPDPAPGRRVAPGRGQRARAHWISQLSTQSPSSR